MTSLKMVIAVVGTLIFLGIFSATAHYKEVALNTSASQSEIQLNEKG